MRLNRARIGLVIIVALGLWASVGQVGWQQGLPLLQFNQSVDQSRIFIKGSGLQPAMAQVTLELRTPSASGRLPIDLVLIIDRSASIDLVSELDVAVHLITDLQGGDRVGIASFSNLATLDLTLTPIAQSALIQGTLTRLAAGGPSALGEGIAVATSELSTHGNSGSQLIEVLISDGYSDSGRDPLEQAKLAADQGITLYAIGVGGLGNRLNRTLMASLAQMTGGQFFPSFDNSVPDSILKISLPQTAVVRNIQIVETLSRSLNFEGSSQNAPTRVTNNADGSTRLEWQVASLDLNASWTTIFNVSGSTTGSFSLDQAPSTITFSDFQGRQFSNDLPRLSLEIRTPSQVPAAAFEFTPTAPTQQDTITFNDRSSSANGKIVSWRWDFGDGATSNDQNPTHRYAQDGSYKVTLTVTDANGEQASVTKVVPVSTPNLTVRRSLNTFLPVDETIPGATNLSCNCNFKVTLDIQINTALNGLGVEEDLPTGWTIKPLESGKASLHSQGTSNQWIFVEKLTAGDTRRIVYQVIVPGPDSSGKLATTSQAGVYQISGLASSALPELSLKIVGEGQIQVDAGFSAKVVVAHWNKDANGGAGSLDLAGFPKHTISFDQIQAAISWWLSGKGVPNTSGTNKDSDNVQLDFKTVETLVAYWLTGVSVFDALPSNQ